jgi:hypothetical protein
MQYSTEPALFLQRNAFESGVPFILSHAQAKSHHTVEYTCLLRHPVFLGFFPVTTPMLFGIIKR